MFENVSASSIRTITQAQLIVQLYSHKSERKSILRKRNILARIEEEFDQKKNYKMLHTDKAKLDVNDRKNRLGMSAIFMLLWCFKHGARKSEERRRIS